VIDDAADQLNGRTATLCHGRSGKEWRGISRGAIGAEGDQRSHYEQTCDVPKRLGIISLRGQDVLIFGDEPLQSSFFRDRDGTLAVARWDFAEREPHFNSDWASEHPLVSRGYQNFSVSSVEIILGDSSRD
jgi:hypothetical protein